MPKCGQAGVAPLSSASPKRWLAWALLLMTAAGWANEPWKRLPPTPGLLPGTVGQHVSVNGAGIWYAQWNVQVSGVPVLLLHGGMGNSNYFGNLIPALVKHGYRVIALDSRGHGRSTAPAEQITYDLMAADVIGVLDHLGVKKVCVVGWSDGGTTGYDLAVHHPERVSRLFAFGANADVSGIKDVDKDPVFSAYLARVADEYRAMSATPERWDSFRANVLRMWETLPAFTAEQLRSIHLPVTVADGEYDEALKREHLRYIAETIRGARLVILPRTSHFAMLQDPAAFNAAVLEFLQH